MAPIEAKYTTISGIQKKVRVEAGEQVYLGRQPEQEACVELIGIKSGGVAIPRNNWDGEPGKPVAIKPCETRELYFHPWRGELDEDPGQDKGLKVVLSGT